MNVKHLFLPLAALFAASLFFSACEENPADANDSTKVAMEAFSGTWVRESVTVNGTRFFDPQTVTFRADSTGSVTMMNNDQAVTVTLAWTATADSLFAQAEGDAMNRIAYTFDGDNRVTLSYNADGGAYLDHFIRWSGTVETALVGDWDLTAQTQDGQPVELTRFRLVIRQDGTGT